MSFHSPTMRHCGTPFLILGAFVLAFAFPGNTNAQELQGLLALSNGQRIPLSEVPPMKGGAKEDFQIFSGIEFTITYEDPSGSGFNAPAPEGPQRQTILLSVLEYLADVLNQPGGKFDLQVLPSISVNSGTLAYAGPFVFWTSADILTGGINNGALFNHLLDGDYDPSETTADMQLAVNWYHNYYVGTGTPSGSQYDLYSILLHEFTHGLGYLCSINYDDAACSGGDRPRGSGWSGSQPKDIYTTFDMLLETGNGHPFISPTYTYIGTSNYFLGGDGGVFTTGPLVAAALGATPQIYAPPSYECGSSMSHWLPALNGVMGPSIMAGVTKRTYLPFEIAFLRDLGYVNAAPAGTEPEGEDEGEEEGALEGEGEGAAEGEGEGGGEGQPCDLLLAPCPDFQSEGAALYAYLNTILVDDLLWNTSDMDGSGIIDRWELAVFEKALCYPLVPFAQYATCVFADNLETLQAETGYAALAPFENALAGMLTLSSEMQTAMIGPLGLLGDYETAHLDAKAPGEPFAPQGDPDGDARTNLVEYQNTLDAELAMDRYVLAALNPYLDGTQEALDTLPLGALWMAGLGGVLGAVGPALVLRRRHKLPRQR